MPLLITTDEYPVYFSTIVSVYGVPKEMLELTPEELRQRFEKSTDIRLRWDPKAEGLTLEHQLESPQVGTDGSLTGFAGGLETKAALLALEARSVGSMNG